MIGYGPGHVKALDQISMVQRGRTRLHPLGVRGAPARRLPPRPTRLRERKIEEGKAAFCRRRCQKIEIRYIISNSLGFWPPA
jgi:hypothetical protein